MGEKSKDQYRIETDEKGEIKIPSARYYGIKTARLSQEWICTGTTISPYLLRAYLYLKQAYAQANTSLNLLDAKVSQSIAQACEEMRANESSAEFIAEALQSIAGITLNTNVNEVLANRAEELLGGNPGDYKLVRVEGAVNLNQNADLLFLLATKIAVLSALNELEPEILNLERLLRRDALTLAKVLKTTSANSQATTGQWGKRLNVFTNELEIAIKRIKEAETNLLEQSQLVHELKSETNANKDDQIGRLMLQNLAQLSSFRLQENDLHVLQEEQSEFVISDLGLISSALKDLATVLAKVAGVAKIAHSVPANQEHQEQPKNNPVQIYADSLHMSAYQIVSNNFAFAFLAQCEQLESMMLMPLLSFNILSTIEILKATVLGFQVRGLL